MTERERASKWMIENGVESIRPYQPEEVVTIAMCYAAERVREELELIRDSTCPGCRNKWPDDKPWTKTEKPWHRRSIYGLPDEVCMCDASLIRKRIAELAGSEQ